MPALPADIAAGTRDAAIETWRDDTVKARFPSAREGAAQPAEGYFDSPVHAAAAIAARGALVGTERRRFAVTADGLQWPNPAVGVPTVRLVDPEQKADAPFLVARVEVDLETETTTYELFG